MIRRPPCSTLFPYPTLFRSAQCSTADCTRASATAHHLLDVEPEVAEQHDRRIAPGRAGDRAARVRRAARLVEAGDRQDRKSTRLNSSHANISYAVFCLKKKK